MSAEPPRITYLANVGTAEGDPTGPFTDGGVSASLPGWRVNSLWKVLGARAEPVEICLRPYPDRPVSTDEVRRLPLGRILADSRSELIKAGIATRRVFEAWPDSPHVPDALTAAGPQRGRRLGDEMLAEIARVYREAWAEGRPVNRAVRDAFHLSPGGAGKRIQAAREAGLLDGVGPKR